MKQSCKKKEKTRKKFKIQKNTIKNQKQFF
jgi:hypothetical protein